MKVAIAAVALLVCLSPTQAVPATPTVTPLEPGKPVSRTLAAGEIHRYAVELAAGAYLRVTVQSREIGVIVTLSRPDGSTMTHVDFAYGRRDAQPLAAVAPVPGTYSVDARPLEKAPTPGNYELAVEVREPGPREARLLEAQTLFDEAERAKGEGTATSFAEAAGRYRRAREIWREGGPGWWEAHATFGLSEAHAMLSEHEQALEETRQLLTLADLLGADRVRARTLGLRGYIQEARGEAAAFDSYREALDLWARFEDLEAEADTLNNLAVVYLARGEKYEALDLILRGLAIKRATGDKRGEAKLLYNIGTFYLTLDDYERAREYYEQSLALNRVAFDRRSQAPSLAALSQIYRALGQAQKAIEVSLEALRIAREAGDRRWEGAALDRAGRAYDAAGDREKARQHYGLALEVYRAIPDPQGEASVLAALGRHSMTAGQPKEALAAFRQALTINQSLGKPQEMGILLNLAATAELALGDYAAARDHSNAALGLIESLRASLPGHQLRGSHLASARESYSFHIDLLMQMHDREPDPGLVAAALETNERARARGFLELLTETGNPPAAADPALLDRDHELEKRLGAAAERQMRILAGPPAPAQAAAVAKEVQDVTREHDLVEAQMRAAGPRSAAVTESQPLTLGEIQRDVLDDRTLLLEYHLGAERSYLWAVTRDTLTAHQLPKAAEIETAARRWHELLSGEPPAGTEASQEVQRQGAALSKMLIGPVAGELRDRRLLVVADGALQYIPFATLPSPAGTDTPLIVDHEVVTTPSASLVAVVRRHLAERRPARKTLAVLADPVFDADDERVGPRGPRVAARTAAPAGEPRAREITRAASGVGLRDGAISRLPFTRREAHAILALVPAGERMEALDFSASRATATSAELAQYRYVHFATHGFANSEHPELSGIVLSLVDPQGREQSGFLTPGQVSNLKLPAELVVLSGCRTALGKEIKGEGLLGLTRAFMSAGAGRVVASLWKVDDAATAELMKTMYERILRGGETPAQALRSAQVAMAKSRRWSAPYYWAAFVIQGEWN